MTITLDDLAATQQSQADALDALASQLRMLMAAQDVAESARLASYLSTGSPLRAGSGMAPMDVPPGGTDEVLLVPAGSSDPGPEMLIADGAVTGSGLADGAVTLAKFAGTVRPVTIVTANPTLPDALYPIGSFIYNTTDAPPRLYKNVANVWTAAVGPNDIQADSITAGQLAAGAVSTSELAVGARLTGELANETGGSPGVFIDSTGILIRSGKMTLQDEFGTTVMVASGFAGSWSDFLGTGLYNGNFNAGSTGALTLGRTASLPYWTTSQVSGSGGLTRTADVLGPSGFRVRCTGVTGPATNSTKLVSDKVRVAAGEGLQFRAYGVYTVEAGGGIRNTQVDVTLKVENKAGGALTGGTKGQLNTVAGSGTFDLYDSVQLGDTAYQAWVEVSLVAAGATSLLDVYQISMLHTPLTLLPAGDYSIGSLTTTGAIEAGGVFTAAGGGGTVVNANGGDVVNIDRIEVDGLFRVGGSSFPGSPSTNDQFYRTDLRMAFFYDGTRWLSTTLYHLSHGPGDVVQNIASTTGGVTTGSTPWLSGGTDIWIENATLGFIIASGGTALGASHKWVGILSTLRDGTTTLDTVATFNIDSGASNAHRALSVTVNALMNNGTVHTTWQADWTKTGTPGNLRRAGINIAYRIVAT